MHQEWMGQGFKGPSERIGMRRDHYETLEPMNPRILEHSNQKGGKI